jgi:hypothetical protein
MELYMSQATDLLETALKHTKIIKAVIDRLASMDAEYELRVLSMRLQETAFRATEGSE